MEPLALSEELHAESLERLCVAALGRGDAAAAFRFVDRRCRIPPLAKAHHFALRAEALNRMGERDSALADLAEAIAIAPDDIHANRRMLAWGKGAARAEAARVLVGQDADPAVIVEALKVLRQEDQRAVASLRVFDEAIAGWVAWNGSGAVALSVLSGARERSYPIAPQDDHPLAAGGFEHIASFEVDRPGSALAQSILLSLDGEPFHAVRAPANRKAERARPRAAAKADAITVIVPIYRDFAATRDCLESLKPEIARRSRDQAILVNDATPEPEIRQYLATFSQVPRFTVLANEVNCGFVASVNRALERTRGGDVVLLNADTIVPPQFIDRLAVIARSHPAIGTVTPLSNNGEFTSFPVPFRQNPVPAKKAARALDRLAARVNEGVAIDIPNGIGFCLYITRACLNAVGPLSEIFQRGYLEDVDFCLRARERGFRNVCAPSVYVSHVGSLSFGADKRSLVVQNLNTIEIKFPDYRTECAAFMAADPLRAARAAIERAMPPAAAFERLIVTGSGLVRAVVDHRADDLQRRKKSVLILSVESGTATVHLHNAAKAVPQSVSFDLAQSAEVQALRKYLTRLKLERIEIADPVNVPQSLLALVAGLERPIDLFVADGGLMCPRGTLRRAGAICPRLAARVACEECASAHGPHEPEGDWRARWDALARRGGGILAPSARAKAFIARAAAGMAVSVVGADSAFAAVPPADPAPRARCGMVTTGTLDDHHLIRSLARTLRRDWPALSLVVIGASLDDLDLMAAGNVFVLGPVEAGEYAKIIRHHRLGSLFVVTRQALFGHPNAIAAEACGLPLAYLDWSFGTVKPRAHDLPLDPALDEPAIAAALAQWLCGSD